MDLVAVVVADDFLSIYFTFNISISIRIWSHTKNFQLNASLIFDLRVCECVCFRLLHLSIYHIIFSFSFSFQTSSIYIWYNKFVNKSMLLFLMNSIHNNHGVRLLIVYADLADEISMTLPPFKTIRNDCVWFSQTHKHKHV